MIALFLKIKIMMFIKQQSNHINLSKLMSRRYWQNNRGNQRLQYHPDSDILQDFHNYTPNPETILDWESKQSQTKVPKMSSKKKKKLENLEKQSNWNSQFKKDSLPLREYIFTKPKGTRKKPKIKQYYSIDLKQPTQPLEILNTTEKQDSIKKFSHKIVNQRKNASSLSKTTYSYFKSNTIDPFSPQNPLRTSSNFKKQTLRSKNAADSIDFYSRSEKQGQKRRKKLGPIITKHQLNPQIDIISSTRLKGENSLISKCFECQVKPSQQQEQKNNSKLSKEKQIGISEAFSFNFKPPKLVERQKQKQLFFSEIQKGSPVNKKLKPIHEQIIGNLIDKDTPSQAMEIIKSDIMLIQQLEEAQDYRQLQVEIEDREAIIEEIKNVMKEPENPENGQILIALIAQYREATLSVVSQLQRWDSENSSPFYWHEMIYVKKIGKDLILDGNEQFDPFLCQLEDFEYLDLDLKERIRVSTHYIQRKHRENQGKI